ncbi:Lipopolysaccharide biosynthesis glycosyltransferase [hydrothermal vent metagenome]|uniref:Lipopolysaccharide biosynthesis glycosyltransferase n=1 Tax=hydrothermal vent metagenome TaxID=652676 RepID=A0A3B1AEN1_9ZZZZ
MSTLSVVILTKNEQDNIAKCLASASWADEIIVYDSNSTDGTAKIATDLGATVVTDAEWQGYGKQRIKAQKHTTCDWVLMLDADEIITAELKTEIQQKLQGNNTAIIYAVPRLSFCFGRFIHHSGWYPDYVYRLYARNKTQYNDAMVHEKLVIPSDMHIEKLKYDLLHYTYKDMNHYLVKSAHYASIWAKDKHASGKTTTLTTAVLHGIACFVKMYLVRAGFLDGKQGFLLALLSAHSTFVKYADLWSYHYKNKD